METEEHPKPLPGCQVPSLMMARIRAGRAAASYAGCSINGRMARFRAQKNSFF